MRNRKNRTMVIGILCCLLVFMGVGFAAMSTRLNIGGTSTAINTWNILIESITPLENSTDAVSVSAEVDQATKTNASFRVDFTKPGDYMEYEIVLKNEGSIDGYLENASVNVADANNADNSLFVITSDAVLGTAIKTGQSISFKVKIEYDKNATRLPSSEVEFILSADILQGEGTQGGNTPGGGTEPESDWLFEVGENGEIISYNYNSSQTETPQEVVVPAEVNGIPVTTITEQSFMPKGNVDLYFNESPTGMYGLIHETEPNFTNALNKLVTMFTMECDGDASCEEQYKGMMYACKDKDTCYNVLNMEQNAKDASVQLLVNSLPNTAVSQGGVYINPDPNVPLEESMVELKPNITSLDLSNATNLTIIEEGALEDVGLDSIDFGDNSNIATIGENAFANNALTEVEIPASVKEIGDNAFSNNQIETLILETEGGVENQLTKNNKYSLTKLGATPKPMATTLNGVKNIGYSAFSNNKIKNLILPSTLESIGSYAFSDNQISELIVPKTVTNLEGYAFSNNPIEKLTMEKCTTNSCSGNSFGNSLKTLIVESGEIGNSAFNYSPNLTSVTLKEGVTSIGWSAFSNSAITSLLLPRTLISIDSSAFDTNQITELTIPKTVTSLSANAFTNNPIETLTIGKCTTDICYYNSFGTQIKNLTIESGEISYSAFASTEDSTTKIESLTLGEGVTSIGYNAFENNLITEITLPNTLTTIEQYAFANNKIVELAIPDSLTYIGHGAFENNMLTNFTLPKTVETVGSDAFNGNVFENLIIEKCTTSICRASMVQGEYSNFGYAIKNLTIESGEIGDYAFRSAEDSTTKIEKLTLGEGVTSIGYFSFKNNAIGELILPSTLTTIGYNAFVNSQITKMYFPKTITNISNYVFDDNVFEELTIEQCTVDICYGDSSGNGYVFGDTIKNLTIESGEIGQYAFYSSGDDSVLIENLVLGDNVTSIGRYAFSGNLISSLTLSNNLKTIEQYAFNNNQITGELVIPNTLTNIGESAFENNQIKIMTVPETVTKVDSAAFKGNPFESLTLAKCTSSTCSTYIYGNSIQSLTIGSGNVNSFAYSGIKFLTLNEGVTSVRYRGFANNQISNLIIPSTVTSIGDGAFVSQIDSQGNSTLTSILIKRTEEDFLANVTVGTNWYDNSLNPTITYDPS